MKKVVVFAAILLALWVAAFYEVRLREMPRNVRTQVCLEGINLSWKESPHAVAYNIYKMDGEGTWTAIAENVSQASYTDQDVECEESYSYSVQAVLPGDVYSGRSVDFEPFLYLEMVELTETACHEGGAYIEWEAIPEAVFYTVYRKEAGAAWKRIATDLTDNSYVDEKAKSSVTYYYTVRAYYEENGEGVLNPDGLSLSYLETPVITLASLTSNGIKIEWEASEGADSYAVLKKNAEDQEWEILAETEELSYEDSDCKDGTEYCYSVKALCSECESACSAEGITATYTEMVLDEGETVPIPENSSTPAGNSQSTGETQTTDDSQPYRRASGYYQISYNIGYSAGYDLTTADFNMGLKVIRVKDFLVNNGYLSVTWDKGTDAWTTYTGETSSAVSRFQSDHGLSATGNVDLATWQAMGYSESDWYSLGAYVTPAKVNSSSTRSDYIEALVATATEYLNAGTAYGGGCSGAPGTAADCSGLILQCLYGAGINPSSVDVVTHAKTVNVFGSRILGNDGALGVQVSSPQRGDLIFYYNGGTITHVALYIGNGQVIESQTYMGVVQRSMYASSGSHKYVRLFW